MRMIIIAIAALVVLGGGGAGAYYYFSQQADASAGSEVGENHEEIQKAEKEKKKEHNKGGYVELVELDPLVLPIVDNNGVSQTVSMVIALEVWSAEDAGTVAMMFPKLKSAYIQDMYGMLSRHATLKGGVIQVSDIKRRLSRISDDVLGEDVVSEVLVQVVQQRAI